MNVGGPELLILLVFLGIVPQVATAIDAAMKSEQAFEAAGSNRTLWIVLPLVGLLTYLLGWIVVLVWLIAIRPKVVAAAPAIE